LAASVALAEAAISQMREAFVKKILHINHADLCLLLFPHLIDALFSLRIETATEYTFKYQDQTISDK